MSLDRTNTRKKFVAANGERIKDLGEKTIPFKSVCIRCNRDGTVIKLDVNNGVYTMGMWVCFDETGPVFSWQGQ